MVMENCEGTTFLSRSSKRAKTDQVKDQEKGIVFGAPL